MGGSAADETRKTPADTINETSRVDAGEGSSGKVDLSSSVSVPSELRGYVIICGSQLLSHSHNRRHQTSATRQPLKI